MRWIWKYDLCIIACHIVFSKILRKSVLIETIGCISIKLLMTWIVCTPLLIHAFDWVLSILQLLLHASIILILISGDLSSYTVHVSPSLNLKVNREHGPPRHIIQNMSVCSCGTWTFRRNKDSRCGKCTFNPANLENKVIFPWMLVILKYRILSSHALNDFL